MKKGIYHTIDAILASFLLIGSLLLIINSPFYEQQAEQKSYISQDVLITLTELKVYELYEKNISFIVDEVINGNITDLNKSVMQQIGEYWAINEDLKAETLLATLINDSIPKEVGFKMSLGDNELILKNISTKTDIQTANRMISGIEKNKPLYGTSASAYLKKIRNKKTAAYTYFGGFVGQGNITTKLELPQDFNSSKITNTELKIETPGTFNIYINENQCGSSYSGTENIVKLWSLTNCNTSLLAGTNNISIRFTSELNTSYISGGFIKAEFTTDTLTENTTAGYKRYTFPEIDGFINLYDSVSAQGLITNWSLNLTFFNQYYTFLTLGNETIFISPGSNTTQTITLNKYNLSLAPTQIPLRLGVTNISNITILDSGTSSDSFLVTDVSGSMGDCGLSEFVNSTYCSYEYKFWFWWFYTECPYTGSCSSNECGGGTTTRNHVIFNRSENVCTATLLELAQDADKLFVSTILNSSTLHEIGLVDFSTNANPHTSLTSTQAVLNSEIDSYSANGGTCTCCGINRARTLVNSSSDKKFIVLVSDGEPTYKCSSFTDYTGDSGTTLENQQWAINAGQKACQENITVYTIGFGDSMSAEGHDVMKQIACNNSLYFNATNVSELTQIYENISNQILIAANFTSQTIDIIGNFSDSKIYENSYLDLYYEPINLETEQNKVSVVVETQQFNSCNPGIYIEPGVSIKDSFITSYSSNHWTKEVTVNDVEIFNLTSYGTEYNLLGDPFIIQIPSTILQVGQTNNLSIEIGDAPTNSSPCSNNNTLIYTVLVNSSTTRTEALAQADGCRWIIETTLGNLLNTTVPSTYLGSKKCYYTNTNKTYNSTNLPSDAYDLAVYEILKQLDYDQDGTIFFDITENDLEIIIVETGKIPYMWGPSILKTEIWQ